MTLWTVTHQAPLSMGFSRQEHWSGLPCPPAGDLPNPGTEPTSRMSPALAGRFFTTSATWEAVGCIHFLVSHILHVFLFNCRVKSWGFNIPAWGGGHAFRGEDLSLTKMGGGSGREGQELQEDKGTCSLGHGERERKRGSAGKNVSLLHLQPVCACV